MNLSPRVSVYRSGTQHGRQESQQRFIKRTSGAEVGSRQTKSWAQQGRASSGTAGWRLALRGQHLGVWSSAVSAVVGSLPQLYPRGSCILERVPALGLFIRVLGTLIASGEFPQEPVSGPAL